MLRVDFVGEARRFSDRRHMAEKIAGPTREPLQLCREAAAFSRPAEEDDRRPVALSREPCPRCQVRGDLGCDHQQPFVSQHIAASASDSRPWSPEEDARVLKLHELGRSARAIGAELAAKLGRTEGAVEARVHTLTRRRNAEALPSGEAQCPNI